MISWPPTCITGFVRVANANLLVIDPPIRAGDLPADMLWYTAVEGDFVNYSRAVLPD
jgi:hypothetical protein